MVRPVLQTQQAGGDVDEAHAWHAMRSDHLGVVTSTRRVLSGAYAERASVCLFLAQFGTADVAVMTDSPNRASEASD